MNEELGETILEATRETLRNVRDGRESEDRAIAFLRQLEDLESQGPQAEAAVASSWQISAGVLPAFARVHGAAAVEKMKNVAAKGWSEPGFLCRYGFMLETSGSLDSAYEVYARVPDGSAHFAEAQHGLGRVEEGRVDFFAGLKTAEAREKAIEAMRRAVRHYERALEADPTRERTAKAVLRCKDALKPGFFNPFGIRR